MSSNIVFIFQANSPLLSSALTSPGGSSKIAHHSLAGSETPPTVLSTTSLKTAHLSTPPRYTNPQQQQTQPSTTSLTPTTTTAGLQLQMSPSTVNVRLPVGQIRPTETTTSGSPASLPTQPHILQHQIPSQQNATYQQRIITNLSQTPNNLLVSPQMAARPLTGLPSGRSGTVVLPNSNNATVGGIRMSARQLQQLPSIPTTNGIILQQMANTVSPTGTIATTPNPRVVIGNSGLVSDTRNRQSIISSVSTPVARYIQTQTGASSSMPSAESSPTANLASMPGAGNNITPPVPNLPNQPGPHSSSQPHTLMLRRGGIPSSISPLHLAHSSQNPSKENLYIVALPSSDQHRVLQYQVGNTHTTNASATTKSQTLILTNTAATGSTQGTVSAVASGNVLKQALGGSITGHISGTASPTQVERRNVAEILASLSGFMPEHQSNSGIISTPPTINVVTTMGSSLQVIPSSKGNHTPTSVASSSSPLIIEPVPSTTVAEKSTKVSSSPLSTTSSGITITAFKSKPPMIQASVTTSSNATIITSTKNTSSRSAATILSSNPSGQNVSMSPTVSSPATRVVRVLQSATGTSGRQIIHQSGGSGLSLASSSSSSTPVVIARKSSVTPTNIVSVATTPTTTPTTTPSPLSTSSGQTRSRKQVLIPVDVVSRMEVKESPNDKRDATDEESKGTGEENAASASDDDSSVAKRIKRRRTSATANPEAESADTKESPSGESKQMGKITEGGANTGRIAVSIDSEIYPSTEFEQDILEEDLDDLEYIPYTSRKSKNKKGNPSNKGSKGGK